ncbi:MAG: hypothetical protein RPU34_02200 [Candidatus Sedimenticola sp. (ex Thyasira tokunagai)]
MKQRTHTWLAIRAIALLDDTGAAPDLVKLLKPHVKGAAIGSWIPDLADSKKGTGDIDNHVFKIKPYTGPGPGRFVKNKQKTLQSLGPQRLMPQFIRDWGGILDADWWATPYKANPTPGEHLANRAMALTTTLIDQLILGEPKVAALVPGTVRFASNLHPNARTRAEEVATYFFMLSHFVADACQPMHCDARRMAGYSNGVHKQLEGHWNMRVGTYFEKKKLFENTDSSNTILNKARVVDQSINITFGDVVPDLIARDTWLEMLSVCRSSFAISSILVPPSKIAYNSTKHTTFNAVFKGPAVDSTLLGELDKVVLHDAVLNIAMVWREVWKTFD